MRIKRTIRKVAAVKTFVDRRPNVEKQNTITFRELIQADIVKGDGIRATAYTASFLEQIPVIGTYGHTQTNDKGEMLPFGSAWSGYLIAPRTKSIDGISASSLRGEAVTKALNQLKGQQTNIAMLLAQRREAMQTANSLLRGLFNACVAVARKDPKGFLRAIQQSGSSRAQVHNASGKYLGTVFGVMPLVDDIIGIVNELTADGREKLVKVSGRAKRSESGQTKSLVDVQDRSGSAVKAEVTDDWTIARSSRCFLTFRLNNEVMQGLSRNGITNPAFVIYDSIRLSFVLEWGIKVGRFLNALDATIGFNYVTGCYSELVESRMGSSLSPRLPATDPTVHPYGSGSGYGVRKSFQRTPISTVPAPSVYFADPLSAYTIAATAALVAQMASRFDQLRSSRNPREFRYRAARTKYLPPITYRKV